MAEIRCPNCGRNNPDLLDVCQFCQSPLKPESVLRIGDTPTKKNTGELESVLPDWLKDVRQQARDSAEEEAVQNARRRKAEDEPPDLLAGLASQARNADEEEVPDWLSSLGSPAKPKPAAPESKPGLLSRFNQGPSKPDGEPPVEEPPVANPVNQSPPQQEKDELSEWFAQAAGQPEETIEFDSDTPPHDAGWGSSFDSALPPRKEPAPPPQEEELGWLRNLEETAKQTGDLKAPKQGSDWMADFEAPSTPSPTSSPNDLSWLDSLGGLEEPQQPVFEETGKPSADLSWLDQFGGIPAEQAPSEEKPSAPEDLSWLNNLGAPAEEPPPVDAAPDQPISPQPFVSPQDLDWIRSLGETTEPAQPFTETPAEIAPSEPLATEDLSWLNDVSAAPESAPTFDLAEESSAHPEKEQEDLSWLKDLEAQSKPLPTPPFTEPAETISPRQTAPLEQNEAPQEPEPDWLRRATEAPSMPPPGDLSMDWFQQPSQPAEEKPAPAAPEPAPIADLFSPPGEPAPMSNKEVDSLFSMEMPDWLSQPEPVKEEPAAPQTVTPPAEGPESLAPVELPSWVQAMRPVEAMISETAPGAEDQPEEKEGPLAGLRGVIPGAPIGSSRRPKAISLKLQASDEQQASAALLEEILGSETSPRTLVAAPFIASQQILRWALTGLFLLVLGAVIVLRGQMMPVSTSLPAEASAVSNTILNLPASAKVLVIVDYEPSLTGEMEATGVPVLNQLVGLKNANLSFISTSPNGSALVERLLAAAKINVPAPDGFGYQGGTQYLNLGYLPGGSAGVLGFLESPANILPASGVLSLTDYAALILMTDHAESGRIWVEQLQNRKQIDPLLAGQPLLVVASAQAGPLFQPYVSSGQVTGMVSGLSEAVRYEASSNQTGIARSYWDAFGVGLMMSIVLIIAGSLWSLFAGIRARRTEAQQG